MLKDELVNEKDVERIGDLKSTLGAMTSRMNSRKRNDSQDERKRQWKKSEEALVKEGKTPYFPKKSGIKKAELYEQFKSIGKDGNMDKFLEKRRKKNATKEHSRLPSSRR